MSVCRDLFPTLPVCVCVCETNRCGEEIVCLPVPVCFPQLLVLLASHQSTRKIWWEGETDVWEIVKTKFRRHKHSGHSYAAGFIIPHTLVRCCFSFFFFSLASSVWQPLPLPNKVKMVFHDWGNCVFTNGPTVCSVMYESYWHTKQCQCIASLLQCKICFCNKQQWFVIGFDQCFIQRVKDLPELRTKYFSNGIFQDLF